MTVVSSLIVSCIDVTESYATKVGEGGAVKPRPPILIFPVKSCDRRYITLYSRI